MTRFMDKSFSTFAGGTDEYRDRWEDTFGKRSEAARPKTGPELAAEYGFKPHGLRPEVAAGLVSAEASTLALIRQRVRRVDSTWPPSVDEWRGFVAFINDRCRERDQTSGEKTNQTEGAPAQHEQRAVDREAGSGARVHGKGSPGPVRTTPARPGHPGHPPRDGVTSAPNARKAGCDCDAPDTYYGPHREWCNVDGKGFDPTAPNASPAYTGIDVETPDGTIQYRTGPTPGDASDAYGLPNDLHAAKEEIHDWRSAFEACGVIGTPAGLRKWGVETGAHHREHHEREDRTDKLLQRVEAALEGLPLDGLREAIQAHRNELWQAKVGEAKPAAAPSSGDERLRELLRRADWYQRGDGRWDFPPTSLSYDDMNEMHSIIFATQKGGNDGAR